MKQKISLLAVCAVLLSLFGAGCLAVVLDPGRKAEEQLAAARKEDVFVLSPADARSVLEQFAPELRFVERQTGVSIDELTGETLALIQTQAAREQYNGSYRFGELMDTLAVFCAGHRVGELPLPAVGPTVTTTVQESFGPLRGAVFAQKSTGEPEGQTQTGTVSLPAGSELAGVDLETCCDKTVSYTLSGPGPDEFLYNGQPPTHRMAYGVLYGTVLKQEVRDGGDVRTYYFVEQSTACALPYTTLLFLGEGCVWADIPHGITLNFQDMPTLKAAVETDPRQFLICE